MARQFRQTMLSARFAAFVVSILLGANAGTALAQTTAGQGLAPQAIVQGPGSVVELARSLKNDPDNIFEFVYKNIEYTPIFGQMKGPVATILDGHGTDFDQASLMVALLRQAGFTANFQYGQIRLNAQQLTTWLGVADICSATNLLANGGIPISTTTSSCSTAIAIDISHVWVQVTINGTNYVFDPSYKNYTFTTPINLASAMGYSQSQLLTAAETGATITATSIQGINRTNLRNQLTAYSNNLVSYLKQNMPAADVDSVIGGKKIAPLTGTMPLRQASLPYQTPGSAVTVWTGDIDAHYKTQLNLQVAGINQTYTTDAIYGHRVTFVYNSALQGVLSLDGAAQATGTAGTAGASQTLTLTVTHPWANNATDTRSLNLTVGNGNFYVLIDAFGYVGRGMLETHRKALAQNRLNGGAETSEPVLGESLTVVGLAGAAQLSRVAQVSDLLAGTTSDLLHVVGVAGQLMGQTGPFMDLPSVFFSVTSNTGNATTPNAASFAGSGDFSLAEGLALDQYLPNTTRSVSTIKLLDMAANTNVPIFDANSGNYTASIRPQLTGYSSTDLSNVDTFINQGYRVILPKNGSLTQNQFTGTGLIALSTAGNPTQFTYYITSILSGGFSDTPTFLKGGFADSPVDPDTFNPLAQNSLLQGERPDQDPINKSVDLFTGDYRYAHADLSIGSSGAFPYSLTFIRSYNSGARLQLTPMGLGWTHNFATTATVNSDGFQGLGEDSPIDTASAIVALFAVLDLTNSTTEPLDRLVISALIQRWLGDQLTNNVVLLTQNQNILQFVQLADGSFNPPPNLNGRLVLSSGTFTYTTKDGVVLSFNAAGNIATWKSLAGVTVTYGYDSNNRLTSVSNGLGRALNFAYDQSGRISTVADNTDRPVFFAYDGNNNLVSAMDPLGNLTTYTYDTPGRLTKITLPSFPNTPAITNTYDTVDRVAAQVDANNSTSNNTTYNFLIAGYRSEVDDPLDNARIFFNTSRGRIVRDIDRLGNVSNSTYDGRDRLTNFTFPEGNGATLVYDDATNPFTTNIKTLTATPKPGSTLAAIVQGFTYDPTFNKVTSATDPLGRITTFSYDSASGNLLSVTQPAVNNQAPITSFTYNGRGQVASVTDPVGTVTQFNYDGTTEELLSIVSDPGALPHLALKTSFTYDAVGNVAARTDPNGNTTTVAYDPARRVTQTTAPSPFTPIIRRFTYDADGRLLRSEGGKNSSSGPWAIATLSYTPTGRLASLTDPDGNVAGYTFGTYAYDQLDRLQKITDAEGRSTTFSYDARGALTQVANPGIQSSPLEQTSYRPNGVPASLIDARGNATSYSYDDFDRLVTRSFPDGSTITIAYDTVGNIISATTRAGGTFSFTYDALNRLITKTPPSPSPIVSYAYDLAGRVVGISDNSASIASVAPLSGTTFVQFNSNYSYDQLNRLISVTSDNVTTATIPTSSSATFNNFYNKVGQRVYQTATDNGFWAYPAGATSVSYSANNVNQYTAVGSVAPTYDANGNLTSDGTFTYTYDGQNRLVSASGAGNTASYAYDSLGFRKSKTVNGVTTAYVRSGDQEVLEYDGTSGQILRRYVSSRKMIAPSGAQTTFIRDIQGSVFGSLDGTAGSVTKNLGYLAYGESANSSGSFRYNGERIDAETNGLYYLRARMYSPALGRFLQPDPLGYSFDDNLYIYASNDPLSFHDRSGENPIGFAIGFVAGAAAGFVGAGGQFNTEGLIGAAVGGIVGGLTGTFATPLADKVGGLAGAVVAQGVARFLAFEAANAGSAAGAQLLNNALVNKFVRDVDTFEGVGKAAFFGAAAPALEGAAFVGALSKVARQVVGKAGETAVGANSGIFAVLVAPFQRPAGTTPQQSITPASNLEPQPIDFIEVQALDENGQPVGPVTRSPVFPPPPEVPCAVCGSNSGGAFGGGGGGDFGGFGGDGGDGGGGGFAGDGGGP